MIVLPNSIFTKDFPEKGVNFLDIFMLFDEPKLVDQLKDDLLQQTSKLTFDAILVPESRGFLMASFLANYHKSKIIPFRKTPKLPGDLLTTSSYSTEYSSVCPLFYQKDRLSNISTVLIHDDILATGGTAKVIAETCQSLNINIVGFSFLGEVLDLKGRQLLSDIAPVFSSFSF